MRKKNPVLYFADKFITELPICFSLLIFLLCGFVFACYVWSKDPTPLSISIIDKQISVCGLNQFCDLFLENLLPYIAYALGFMLLGGFCIGFALIPFVLSFKAMGFGYVVCSLVFDFVKVKDFSSLLPFIFEFACTAVLFYLAFVFSSISKGMLTKQMQEKPTGKAGFYVADVVLAFVMLIACVGAKTAVVSLCM